MLFEITSKKTREQIDTGLHESAARHKFGIITVHDLKETMRKKGVEFGGECLIGFHGAALPHLGLPFR